MTGLSQSTISMYGSMGYPPYGNGYGSYGSYGSFGGNSFWQKWMNMTPSEREEESLKRYESRLAHQKKMKMKEAEANVEIAEHSRNLEAERTRQITSAALEAKNVQTILRTGKIDLFDKAWKNYLEELKNIPEIAAQYCDEYGNWKSEADMRSAAIKYYNKLNSPDGGTTMASFDDDAALLPTSFWQGMWHGATFGFYKKAHHGDVMKTAKGIEISKEDRLFNGAGDTLGTAAAAGAAGFGLLALAEAGGNKFGNASDIQKAVDWTNLQAAENLLQKGETFEKAEERLRAEAKDAEEQIKLIEKEINANEQDAFDKAKQAKEAAEKELQEKTATLEQKQTRLAELEKKIPKNKNGELIKTSKDPEIRKLINEYKQLNNEIPTLQGEVNKLNTSLAKDGKLVKEFKAAETALNNAKETRLKPLEKELAKINSQKEMLAKVTPEMRFASEAVRTEMKDAAKKVNQFQFGRGKGKAVADITDAVNNGKTSVKQIAKQIAETQGSNKSKFFAKYFKGRYGAAIGAVLGAGIGIYNWCTND